MFTECSLNPGLDAFYKGVGDLENNVCGDNNAVSAPPSASGPYHANKSKQHKTSIT
jgi:hypothetical protein